MHFSIALQLGNTPQRATETCQWSDEVSEPPRSCSQSGCVTTVEPRAEARRNDNQQLRGGASQRRASL